MITTPVIKFEGRQHAATLLAERLFPYRNTDAVVVAIPNGGIPVGYHLAKQLQLPLVAMACKKIQHPGDPSKTIGSVSSDEIVMHEVGQDIPQDYIYHQIMMAQRSMKAEDERCNQPGPLTCLKDKTVILADDFLKTGDTMLACLKAAQKQQPGKIIIAVPVATPEAINAFAGKVDEIVYLISEPGLAQVSKWFDEFPQVAESEVSLLMDKARKELNSSTELS